MQLGKRLISREFSISPGNAEKLKSIAERENVSQDEILRRAIDIYDLCYREDELLDVALSKANEALEGMQKTSAKLNTMLEGSESSLPIEVTEAELELLRSFLQRFNRQA